MGEKYYIGIGGSGSQGQQTPRVVHKLRLYLERKVCKIYLKSSLYAMLFDVI